jgi:hypothetical protein
MFSSYRPSDWRGMISEYLAIEEKRQNKSISESSDAASVIKLANGKLH